MSTEVVWFVFLLPTRLRTGKPLPLAGCTHELAFGQGSLSAGSKGVWEEVYFFIFFLGGCIFFGGFWFCLKSFTSNFYSGVHGDFVGFSSGCSLPGVFITGSPLGSGGLGSGSAPTAGQRAGGFE